MYFIETKIGMPWCTIPLEIEKDEKMFKEEGGINSKDYLLSWMHCKSRLTVTSILQNVEYNPCKHTIQISLSGRCEHSVLSLLKVIKGIDCCFS